MKIIQINSKETLEIRSKVLRPNLPISTCEFLGDDDEKTFHLGGYLDDKLIGVASFYSEDHDEVERYQNPYRLRGMATLDEYRGRGVGKNLLNEAFLVIKERQGGVLWCNARTNAIGFYEKLGFSVVGEEFEIEGVGPHFVMVRGL